MRLWKGWSGDVCERYYKIIVVYASASSAISRLSDMLCNEVSAIAAWNRIMILNRWTSMQTCRWHVVWHKGKVNVLWMRTRWSRQALWSSLPVHEARVKTPAQSLNRPAITDIVLLLVGSNTAQATLRVHQKPVSACRNTLFFLRDYATHRIISMEVVQFCIAHNEKLLFDADRSQGRLQWPI